MQMQLTREQSCSSPTQDEHSSSQTAQSLLNDVDVSKSQKESPKKTPDQIQTKTPNPKEKIEARGSKNRKAAKRSSSFPRSKVVHAEEEDQNSDLHGEEPDDSECSSVQRSFSLPDSFKLVSALKGSRESPRSPNLHVRWDPDVYDPPVTSSSHTVTSGKGGDGSSSSKGKKKGKKKEKNNNRRKNKG